MERDSVVCESGCQVPFRREILLCVPELFRDLLTTLAFLPLRLFSTHKRYTPSMSPIELELITLANVMEFKAVRLAALCDSPGAFGSTYSRECQLTDADWLKRAAIWTSEKATGHLAKDAACTCGMAAGFLEEHDPRQSHLVSMWVAPTHRLRGVGTLLIDAVAAWSRERGARAMRLMVTSSNGGAIRFYERSGFSMTGRTQPYPNDSALIEYEMTRALV
jgi:ribosomal protein S18 acetylase RimI-like enzyme